VLREPTTRAYLASLTDTGYSWTTRREQAMRFVGLEETERGRERLEAMIARDWMGAGCGVPRVRMEIVFWGYVREKES